jgi:hypothetical protein
MAILVGCGADAIVGVGPGVTIFDRERDGFEGDALPVLSDIDNLDDIPGCGIGDWDNCAKSIRVMPPGS